MNLQIPFIVALVVMGVAMLVFAAWTLGPAAQSHRWQQRGHRRMR